MQGKKSFLIILLVLVVLIAGAAAIYNILIKNNGGTALESVPETNTVKKDEQTEDSDLTGTEEGRTAGSDLAGIDGEQTADPDLAGKEEEQTAAPDFTVIDMEGNEVSLSDFKGKPAVINFWATWCKPCTSELAAFNTLYGEYKDNVSFLMVNLTDGVSETVDGVKAFVLENGYSFPVFFDTEQNAVYAYSIYSIPRTVFVDAQGNIKNAYMGAMSEELIEKYIEDLTMSTAD